MSPRPRKKKGDELVPRPTPLPWERQQKEPIRAYGWFAHYRDLGYAGSLAKAAENLGKSVRTLEEMSSKWNWPARRDAYLDHWERLQRDARETELLRAERQEAAVGRQMAAIGGTRFFGRDAGVASDGTPIEPVEPINPAELDAVAAATLVEKGIRIRRLAMGQPTDVLKGMHSISTADLLRVAEAMYEIAHRLWGADPLFARYASEVQMFIDTGRMPWQDR